jgi:hypothetical protein
MTFDSGLLCSAVFYVAKVIDLKEKTDNIIDGNN